MIRKYSVLICLILSTILIIIATLVYPGGSLIDPHSRGFAWSKNFMCDLFAAKAINGSENTSRIWALFGIAFHSLGYGIFFIRMSRKIPSGHAAIVLKLIGAGNMVFTFLVATPLHDIMVTISSTLFLLGLFYITVYTAKAKLNLMKFACIICLVIFYYTLFVYGSGDLGTLAVMQKISFICSMVLVLGLEHFTNLEDFKQIEAGGQVTQATHR